MTMRSLVVVGVLLTGVLGGWTLSALTGEAGGSQLSSDVLATVGKVKLTRADVELTSPEAFLGLERQRHALTEEWLNEAIRLKLVEVEADARGMHPTELVEQEVFSKVPEPTDAEIEEVFRNSGAPGSVADATPQIRTMIKRRLQNERYEAFLDELRERYPVETRLEPLRTRIDAKGYPAKGADNAAVTIVEFADFQCPYCREFVGFIGQIMAAYGEDVRFVYRHLPLTSIHPGAQKAAEASLCANDQGRFWDMHDALYADPVALSSPKLKQVAASLGLKQDEFDKCLDGGKHKDAVDRDAREARLAGVAGTPGVFINGRYIKDTRDTKAFVNVLLDELRRAGKPTEARRLEPIRRQIEADGFPSRGPASAPVTVVEFADFQCPFCQEVRRSIDQMLAAYPEQVRFVYRQYPIAALHPEAPKASEASLCANEQNRFWDMHDALYANAKSLSISDLKSIARSVGLDGARFDSCLDSGRFANAVNVDIEAAKRAGASGTPAFFINGRFLDGFQRFDDLKAVIDDELANVRK